MSEDPRYRLIIAWSDEDQQFIVTVPELSGCRTSGETLETAIEMARDAVGTWLDIAEADGRPIPPPQKFDYDADTAAVWPDRMPTAEQRERAARYLEKLLAEESEPAAA